MRGLLVVLSILAFAACSNDHGAGTVNAQPGGQAEQPVQPDEQPTATPPLQPQAAPPANPPTPPPDARLPEVMTPEECEAAGGTFRPSRGGQIECEAGETKIADVKFGIEGGICCK